MSRPVSFILAHRRNPPTSHGATLVRLEQTFSRAEVMEHLGCKPTKLHELCANGRKFKHARPPGVHPLKGGLWPVDRLSHKNVRIYLGAIERHKAHMNRLRDDAMFRAEMTAQARLLGEGAAA